MYMQLAALPMLVALSVLLGGCAMVAGTAGVAGAARTAADRRIVRVMVEDEAIEWQVRDALHKAEVSGEAIRVNVTSYNRLVLLTGQVPDEDTKKRAVATSRRVRGVRAVHNELVVGPQLSAMVWSSDGLMTARAKVAIAATAIESPVAVKVVTEDSVVYLMGLVSRQEAKLATDAVRTVPGVREIVRLFENTD